VEGGEGVALERSGRGVEGGAGEGAAWVGEAEDFSGRWLGRGGVFFAFVFPSLCLPFPLSSLPFRFRAGFCFWNLRGTNFGFRIETNIGFVWVCFWASEIGRASV
jgi:hypothetical protein